MMYNKGIRSCSSRLTPPIRGGIRMPSDIKIPQEKSKSTRQQRSLSPIQGRKEVICFGCGVKFYVTPRFYEKKHPRVCSMKCQGAWLAFCNEGEKSAKWTEGINVVCQTCGKTFRITSKRIKTAKYCSRKCHALHKAKEYGGPDGPYSEQVENVCVVCGKVYCIKPSHAKWRVTCSRKCHFKRMSSMFSGEGNPSWCNGLSRFPYPIKFNAALKRKIRDRDGYMCTLCGKTEEENGERLSIHHIDYNKDNCDESNLTSVCRPCNGRVNVSREMWTIHFQKRMVKIGIRRH